MSTLFVFIFIGLGFMSTVDSRRCPSHWRSYLNQCYLFTKTRSSWFDAQVFCRSVNAIVAQPKSYRAYKYIYNVVVNHIRGPVWLGASDIVREDHYKWLSGGTMNVFRWCKGQPSGGRKQNCLAVRHDGMHDYPCSYSHNYIACEKKQ